MIEWFKNLLVPARAQRKIAEAHDEARLEDAQREVAALCRRSDEAVRILTSRHERNHYGEAIARMIQGVP